MQNGQLSQEIKSGAVLSPPQLTHILLLHSVTFLSEVTKCRAKETEGRVLLCEWLVSLESGRRIHSQEAKRGADAAVNSLFPSNSIQKPSHLHMMPPYCRAGLPTSINLL